MADDKPQKTGKEIRAKILKKLRDHDNRIAALEELFKKGKRVKPDDEPADPPDDDDDDEGGEEDDDLWP
jgi:hypothetical protein